MILRRWSIAIKKNIGENAVFSCWVWWSSLRGKKKKNMFKKSWKSPVCSSKTVPCHLKACYLSDITVRAKRDPFHFSTLLSVHIPLPVMWLAALVKSATQSPITRKGCEVYESDYGPIFPEIRTLSPGSSGPHGASQAWPQTRVVFSPLSLLIAVKQRLCLRGK